MGGKANHRQKRQSPLPASGRGPGGEVRQKRQLHAPPLHRNGEELEAESPPPRVREGAGGEVQVEGSIARLIGDRLHVTLRVTPRAARDALTLEDGELRARLHAPPVEGAANAALLALLATRLGLPKSALEIVRGATARHKTIAVSGLTPDAFWRRLGL